MFTRKTATPVVVLAVSVIEFFPVASLRPFAGDGVSTKVRRPGLDRGSKEAAFTPPQATDG